MHSELNEEDSSESEEESIASEEKESKSAPSTRIVRINGFQRPFSKEQVCAWVVHTMTAAVGVIMSLFVGI